MADNVAVTAGAGTTIAADEIVDGVLGTVKVQYVKLIDGTLDGTTKVAATANGLKVDPSAVTSPVSAASLPLPTGASTETTLAALNTKINTEITADYDTGAGTQTMKLVGLALPGAGGSVAGGTATNPVQVSLANTAANATAVKVDGSAVTQPVSAAALPLPTGASTSAIQSETHGTVAAGTAATKSELVGGVFNTVAPTLTNGQQAAAQLDSSGNLKVNVAVGGAGGTSSTFGAAFPATGTAIGATDGTNMKALKASASNMLYVQLNDGTTALPILAASTGAPAASAPALAVSVRDANANGQAAMSASAPVVIASDQSAVSVKATVATTGGATPAHYFSAASTNATSTKASAGTVYGVFAVNTTATVYYLKLYNKASAPTVGTDVPVLTIPVPASTSGAGINLMWPMGVAFGTGIAWALTAAAADADTGVAATGVTINLVYA